MNHQNTSSYQSRMKLAMGALVQVLMDIEVSQMLAANRYERSSSRRAYRNGYRTSMWETPIGQIEIRIPKLRRGTYYPDQLLNDELVRNALITLVKKCVHHGVDIHDVQHTVNLMDVFTISTYELHQIYEALQVYSARSQNHQVTVDVPEMLQFVMQERNTATQNLNELTTEDKEFWREFTRRMQHQGYNLEDYQSVLSTINPYAIIDNLDMHPNSLKIEKFVIHSNQLEFIA